MLPGNREILLWKAGMLELSGKPDDAGHLLSDIRNRWPEWYPGWVVYASVLKLHNQREQARAAVATAMTLGSPADILNLDLTSVLLRSFLP